MLHLSIVLYINIYSFSIVLCRLFCLSNSCDENFAPAIIWCSLRWRSAVHKDSRNRKIYAFRWRHLLCCCWWEFLDNCRLASPAGGRLSWYGKWREAIRTALQKINSKASAAANWIDFHRSFRFPVQVWRKIELKRKCVMFIFIACGYFNRVCPSYWSSSSSSLYFMHKVIALNVINFRLLFMWKVWEIRCDGRVGKTWL